MNGLKVEVKMLKIQRDYENLLGIKLVEDCDEDVLKNQ